MWEEIMKHNSNVKAQLVKGKVVHAKPRKSVDHDNNNDNNDNNNKNDSNYHYLWNVQLEDGTVLPADAILFACGPWTTVGNCMTGVKYHSVIIPTRPKVLTQSIFYNGFGDPEVYPRPDGTAYCCGFPDAPVVVQEEPGREEVRQEKVEEILYAVRAASGSGSSSSGGGDGGQGGGGGGGVLGQEPELVQSCYLPCTPDNIPMMGKVVVSMDETDKSGSNSAPVDGCYVAAGHGCWGILMGPATGEAMANLILTGESSKYVDLAPFSPERFQ
jgi:Glycine/D-amino acid oxidases (deaminating)